MLKRKTPPVERLRCAINFFIIIFFAFLKPQQIVFFIPPHDLDYPRILGVCFTDTTG